jgi:thioredoxin reductase (NADPH)
MVDAVVLGAGPAGLSAAIYAARAGLSVTVIENRVAGGQAATAHWIENYPGFDEGIGGADLMEKMVRQMKNLGVEIASEQVTELSLLGEVKVVKTEARTIESRGVILCMGGSPRKLDVPGELALSGMGVSYCATCDGFFFRNREVVIVGGGDAAVTEALYLSQLCKKVTLIHRRQGFRAAQTVLERLYNTANIELMLDSVITSIQGEGRVERIEVHNTANGTNKTVECAAVFVAVGYLPQSEMVKGQVALDPNGYIIADPQTMRTNVPMVYAAGDIRNKYLRQIVTACADGAIAASDLKEAL